MYVNLREAQRSRLKFQLDSVTKEEKIIEKNTGKKLDVMYGWSLSVKKSRQAGFIFRSYFFFNLLASEF